MRNFYAAMYEEMELFKRNQQREQEAKNGNADSLSCKDFCLNSARKHKKGSSVLHSRAVYEEFAVCGYFFANSGSLNLILGKYRDEGVVYKGHVTVLAERNVICFLKKGKCPFRVYPVNRKNIVWCVPDHVCVVEFPPGGKKVSRQGVYLGLRDDVYGWNIIDTE